MPNAAQATFAVELRLLARVTTPGVSGGMASPVEQSKHLPGKAMSASASERRSVVPYEVCRETLSLGKWAAFKKVHYVNAVGVQQVCARLSYARRNLSRTIDLGVH